MVPLLRRYSQIRVQATFAFGVVSLGIGALLVYHLTNGATQALTQRQTQALQAQARPIALLIDDGLAERQREVALLARRYGEVIDDPGARAEFQQRYLDAAQASYRYYTWIGAASLDGRVTSATRGLLLGESVAARPWFSQGKQGDYIGDAHYALLLQRLLQDGPGREPLRLIDFASPVTDRAGHLRGVLAAHVQWSWVDDVIHRAGHPDDSIDALLVGHDGQVLHPFDPQHQITSAGTAGSLPAAATLSWSDRGPCLTTSVAVSGPGSANLGWRVVLRQPVSVALAPAIRFRDTALLAGAVALPVLLLLFWWLAGRLQHVLQRHVANLRQYRDVVEEQSDLICRFGPDHRVTLANSAFCAYFGKTPSDFVGKAWAPLVYPADLAHVEAELARLTPTEPFVAVTNRLVTPHGVRWVQFYNRAFFDANGHLQEVLSVGRDITAIKVVEEARSRSEALLTRIGTLAGVGGWEYDPTSHSFSWTDLTRRLHRAPDGFNPSLQRALDFFAPEWRNSVELAVRRCAEEGKPFDFEAELVAFDGSRFWVRFSGEAEREGDRVVGVIGTLQDVQRKHEIEAQLAESNELMRVTLESIGDAVITTDQAGLVTWLNPVAEGLTGWRHHEALGRPIGEVFRICDAESSLPCHNPVEAALASGERYSQPLNVVLLRRDGAQFGIEDSAAPIRDLYGTVLGAVLVFHDVSERQRLSREMTWRATHDALTGLTNRAEFEVRLAHSLRLAQSDDRQHVLLFIDLDEFKAVNDTAGHAAGDDLLCQVASVLEDCVRSHDTVARLGGDEFAILLEDCPVEHGSLVAKKVCELVDNYRFHHDTHRYRIGTSIGVVAIEANSASPDLLMQAADSACYAAKTAGRNRIHVWQGSDPDLLAQRMQSQWSERLQAALDQNAFTLHAQRIVPCQTGNDAHAAGLCLEVLLRLPGDDGKLTLPGEFIPAAERFHLASRLDRWVLQHTCQLLGQQAAIAGAPHVQLVTVNLSGQSISDRAFQADVLALLRTATFDLRVLCLEVTETVAIANIGLARNFFEQLRSLGVRVALDDFGAGASSFGYLRNLPVDFLKIDGQFVRGLLDNPLDAAAVRCFTEVAQLQGLITIAEHVEIPAQQAALAAMGVDYLQGYLLHRPEPLAQLLAPMPAPTQAAA